MVTTPFAIREWRILNPEFSQHHNPARVGGPRQPDGSLPDLAFMRPKPGSRLLEAGISVALPFKGAAPDLGAFETK